MGFLGGLQWSLQTAAADVSRGEEPSKYRYPFVHNGKVFYLEVRGHAVDDRRQRRYAEAGLMASDAVLHRFNFRILDDKRDTVQSFELWAALPVTWASPLVTPVIPLAFEFKARAFLELRAVRVLDASAPPP